LFISRRALSILHLTMSDGTAWIASIYFYIGTTNLIKLSRYKLTSASDSRVQFTLFQANRLKEHRENENHAPKLFKGK
jgi:hypothetical protein